jgi:L-ribulose-5-phosphate 3-epimerase
MGTIGFMQGRLSPPVNGKIQAFPWENWRSEFKAAQAIGMGLMEWTLDQEGLHRNPLLTPEGQREIRALAREHGVQIQSLTGDNFMHAPFYKATGEKRAGLMADLRAILESCAEVGIRYALIPLVDAGRLENEEQELDLLQGLAEVTPFLLSHKMKVLFESDFPPAKLAAFIAKLPAATFGINYDIGNSASLGFKPAEELAAYGERVDNVHVKDRLLGGTTVPLGTGSADFITVFHMLKKIGYRGDFILQTARAADGDHAGAIQRYREFTQALMAEAQA